MKLYDMVQTVTDNSRQLEDRFADRQNDADAWAMDARGRADAWKTDAGQRMADAEKNFDAYKCRKGEMGQGSG